MCPRDVSTGTTGMIVVAPKFSDSLILSPAGKADSANIAEVATKFSLW